MIIKTIKCNQVKLVMQNLENDIDKSIYQSLEYMCQKVMVKHFTFSGQGVYNYPKLSPKYAARKLRKYGVQPLLVASGELKNKVLAKYKIIRKGKNLSVYWDLPEYGRFVIQNGRDWRILVDRDRKDINRFRHSTFRKLRTLSATRLYK